MRGSALSVSHEGILVLPDIIFYFSFKCIDFFNLFYSKKELCHLFYIQSLPQEL